MDQEMSMMSPSSGCGVIGHCVSRGSHLEQAAKCVDSHLKLALIVEAQIFITD